jgi:hypothetical protein
VKVGDLVRVKYDGKVRLITNKHLRRFDRRKPTGVYEFHLLGEDVTFTSDRLEIISASR